MFAPVNVTPSASPALRAALDAVRRRASGAPSVAQLLRASDALIASALSLLSSGGFASGTGMPAASLLQYEAGRTATDAKMLMEASSVLASMPRLSEAFSSGSVSWSVVRVVVCAVRALDATGRAEIDELFGSAPDLDPEALLFRVDAVVARRRDDLVRAREDRAIERSFLAIQGRFDGSASFYGEGDAASIATLVDALDAAADAPVRADDPDAPSRAQQRYDALIRVCESSLGGGATGTRPRPRLLATVDLDSLAQGTGGAQLLWSLTGRAPRISSTSTETLLCDAEIVPVAFREGRAVGVGRATSTIPKRLRAALIARDGGCRFPGCRAPASWTDAHHIQMASHGGATTEDNCLLLCRRCHRRVHRFGWQISLQPDGVINFRRRGRRFASQPHRVLRA